MATVNVYLIFKGNCEAAFNFYKNVFGGEFDYMGKFKDMPPAEDGNKCAPADENLVMHVSLPISKETVLMGSDNTGSFGNETIIGNNFSVSINADSMEESDRFFNSLSQGGKVGMPMNKTFWGAYFGMLTDQFGINWMINHDTNEKKTI